VVFLPPGPDRQQGGQGIPEIFKSPNAGRFPLGIGPRGDVDVKFYGVVI